ncbi:MAG: ExeM/NucH family extracellular endonuclease [Desulfobacteraceae bacterium]|nr:ExeM/NucH family extracellular endonuclease [Desulfobacteraceae bacterium]
MIISGKRNKVLSKAGICLTMVFSVFLVSAGTLPKLTEPFEKRQALQLPGQPEITPVHQIQGAGLTAIPGTYTIEAVVTGDYQQSDELSGFFIQEEIHDQDDDPDSSEAIFVFCGDCPVDVKEGNIVQVTGQTYEFFNMSQLLAIGYQDVIVIDQGDNIDLISPAIVDLPAAGPTDMEITFERYEAMLVTFAHDLAITELYQLARFGQIILSPADRQWQFTHLNTPDVSGYRQHTADSLKARIILDDFNNQQNMDPVIYPRPKGFAVDNYLRSGYTVKNLTGVLHWSWAGYTSTNAWRIRPMKTAPVLFQAAHPRSQEPKDVGGTLKVASFNVLNYFNGDGMGAGFPTSRGAHSKIEFERQTDKIVSALEKIDADIFGLVELENDYEDGQYCSAASLVKELNDKAGSDVYTYVIAPGSQIGDDEIAVGFIYNKTAVELAEGTTVAVLDSPPDVFQADQTNRASLAATFEQIGAGQQVTISVNHFKSKGGYGLEEICTSPDADANCDQYDGQGYWNHRRTRAAEAIIDWLARKPTGTKDPDVLIIGDLNAYAMEDPIMTLINSGYTDLVDAFIGPSAYSYAYDGRWGYLDYALSSQTLFHQVTGADIWHINSDEVSLLDYNDTIRDTGEKNWEAKPSKNELYNDGPYRCSDHDPVIIGLRLDSRPLCNGKPATIYVREDKYGKMFIVGGPMNGRRFKGKITGTIHDDVIAGTSGRDLIMGLAGSDLICAKAGNDRVFGGLGHDIIYGGAGQDKLIGNSGANKLYGGDGFDHCSSGAYWKTIYDSCEKKR